MYSSLLDTDIPIRFGVDTLPGWERRVLPLGRPVFRRTQRACSMRAPAQATAALAAVDAASTGGRAAR